MRADKLGTSVTLQVSAATVPMLAMAASSNAVQGLESLFRAHYPELARIARALGAEPGVAEDLAQETFLLAHVKLRAGARGASPRAWLYGILRRLVANHRRSRQRARARERVGLTVDGTATPEQQTARREAAEILQRFLTTSPHSSASRSSFTKWRA